MPCNYAQLAQFCTSKRELATSDQDLTAALKQSALCAAAASHDTIHSRVVWRSRVNAVPSHAVADSPCSCESQTVSNYA